MSGTILTEYNLTSSLLNDKTTIATFSDVHGESTKLEKIKDIIKELKIAYAFIPGDTIESVVGSDYSRDRIIELLQEISKFTTIIYTHGNHDTVYAEAEPEEDRERLLENNYKLWNRLKDTDNVFIPELPNNGVTTTKISLTDDIDAGIISITPEYYWYKEQLSDYEKYFKELDNIDLSSEKFNILLAHSPKNIVRGNHIDDNLKRFNLILSGHMHSGLIPYGLKSNKLRRGLLGPGKKVFPANSYGIVQDEDTISMISGGVIKVGDGSFGAPLKKIPGVKSLLEHVYSAEVEIINLVPGKENEIKKSKILKI